MSLHQQRLAKYYYITIYGDVIKPSTPLVQKTTHDLDKDTCSFILKKSGSKIEKDGLTMSEEIEQLEILCRATLECYFNEESSTEETQVYSRTGTNKYCENKIKAKWDWFMRAKLYERGTILKSNVWGEDDEYRDARVLTHTI